MQHRKHGGCASGATARVRWSERTNAANERSQRAMPMPTPRVWGLAGWGITDQAERISRDGLTCTHTHTKSTARCTTTMFFSSGKWLRHGSHAMARLLAKQQAGGRETLSCSSCRAADSSGVGWSADSSGVGWGRQQRGVWSGSSRPPPRAPTASNPEEGEWVKNGWGTHALLRDRGRTCLMYWLAPE